MAATNFSEREPALTASVILKDLKAELQENGTWIVQGSDQEKVQQLEQALDHIDTEDRRNPLLKLLEAVARCFDGKIPISCL